MKIRTKLTLRYAGVTASVFSLFVLVVFIFSEQNREKEFFRDLIGEAVTKANLFISDRVDAEIMQSIYHNNRQFIDEVEVAVYTTDFELLYHDAQEIDIIKETRELIDATVLNTQLKFYEGDYQCISMLYRYEGVDYVITAAAYDGYGYAKLKNLTTLLIISWILGLVLITGLGYLLARRALQPVSEIINEIDIISASSLDRRLSVKEEHDELDELSKTFNQMLDRLEKSFDSQKMFVNNASHELRTPLASLITELEISSLREERSNEEYKRTIANVLNDAMNLKHLINGLLDLAKSNYDISQIATEELRLDELLLDARKTILRANKLYSVELVFGQDIEDDTLITVSGNEYLLKTAFVNLMENNCKFSDNHTSLVQISFFEKNAIIRFSDTGIGIPRDEVEKIFTPFYRGTNSNQTKGQGIGLTLTQRIITLHNGTIAVRSHIEEGTTFIIGLPHIQHTNS